MPSGSCRQTWRREGCPPLPHHTSRVCGEVYLTLPYLSPASAARASLRGPRAPAARCVGAKTDASSRRGRCGKTSTSTSPSLLVSSRLVAGAHVREARQGRRVRSAKAAIRTRSHPARRQRAAAKGAALASWRCCCLGSTICTAERGGARQYTAEAASDDVSYLFAPVEA